MERYAFKMQLRPGCEAEYQSRHDAIWPELVQLLKESGISEYSIHLDCATGTLFGILTRNAGHTMADLPDHPVMQRWWAFMADLMETHADQQPVATPLTPMFYLP